MRLGEILNIQAVKGDTLVIRDRIVKGLEKLKDVTIFVDSQGNISATKGSGDYSCFIARVNPSALAKSENFKAIRLNLGIWVGMSETDGVKTMAKVGGEKAGIYAAFKLLRTLDNVKCLFIDTSNPEAIAAIPPQFFSDCRWAAGLDMDESERIITGSAHTSTVTKDFLGILKDFAKKEKFEIDTVYYRPLADVRKAHPTLEYFDVGIGQWNTWSEHNHVVERHLEAAIRFCSKLHLAKITKIKDTPPTSKLQECQGVGCKHLSILEYCTSCIVIMRQQGIKCDTCFSPLFLPNEICGGTCTRCENPASTSTECRSLVPVTG